MIDGYTQQLMTNPEDKRQVSHRYGAEWGKKRLVQKGTMYEKCYAANLDDAEELIEYTPVGQKQEVIMNAKRWAGKKYPKLNQDDICQEIEIKAWMLETNPVWDENEGWVDHVNQEGEWARPAYVMTALKNAVHDYARQEIGYEKVNKVTGEIIMSTRFDAPAADYDITFTNKTLKAALLLFVAAPYSLSHGTKDTVYNMVYKNLTKGEHKALFQCVIESNDTANKTLDKVVAKYISIVNGV